MSHAETFGRYRLISELGKGATGTVFLAEGGGERVALKILHRSLASDPVLRRRFRREASLARELRHPGIARVYDLVEHEGREALSMEYCPGGSLAGLLQARGDSGVPGVPSADQAEDWLRQLASALGYAHARAWIHRSVKPENILVGDDGRLRLSDFGSARLENLSGLTTSTTYLATPLYIAPEVMRGDPVRPAHDLYSLGAVFYRLLAGKPHREGGLTALLSPESASYEPLAELLPDLPRRLSALVDALLAPVDERPGSARAALDLLDGLLEAEPAPGKRCLFCDASMPADSPFCLACGREDVYPEEYRGADAEALVLTKLAENAEATDRLYAFLRAWDGDATRRYRFITEDRRLYGKEELKEYLQLPYPLINWLRPETAELLVKALELKGFAALHLERRGAAKVEKKAGKKPPILPAERPRRYKPLGSELLAPQAGARPAAVTSLYFDCQRLADMLKAYRPDAPDRLRSLAARSEAMAADMQATALALDAVSLPELYAEETRLEYALADEATMASAAWGEAKARLRRNEEAWRRYEELEAAYALGAQGLEERRLALQRIVRALGEALDRADPVAQSRAIAAFDELIAASEP